MKLKVSLLVTVLYFFTLLISSGLFNTVVTGKAETGLQETVDTCSAEIYSAFKAPAVAPAKTYDTYLDAYFTHLTENFGQNDKGSCGYVAMGMLLSYFDSYMSDDIIPERYDFISNGYGRNMIDRNTSPGIIYDNWLYDEYHKVVKKVTAQEYYDYLLNYEHKSFHAKLIVYANQLAGLYNFDVPDDKDTCGTTTSEQIYILKCYLMYERAFKYFTDFDVYSERFENEEEIKQFIIEQIDNGYPVCTSIGKYQTDGEIAYHAVVAYAHDADGTIYFHPGWHGADTKQTLSSINYDFFNNAFVLRFFLSEHTHSDNYAIEKSDKTNYYCYCSDEIVTYKHTEHNYVLDLEYYDSTNHKAYCACDDYSLVNHTYNARYEKTNSDTTHTAFCACGHSTAKKHLWTAYSLYAVGAGSYVQCKQCKFVKKLTGGDLIPILPTKFKSLIY